ncbi:MAG: restriction endonuclease subunit S [Chloroflexota bacterium]|nr:restriction endonuclease subunit S [Chloroflexota bacterium]
MTDNWELVELGKVSSFISRGSSPSYADTGLLVLNQRCIRDQRIDWSHTRRTDTQTKRVSHERHLRVGDVLVNSTGVGTLGRVAQVEALPEPATVDSHVTIVRPDPAHIDPMFLGFAIRAAETDIEAMAEGSTGQTELGRARLAGLQIPRPPAAIQREIAEILSCFDHKIELNRNMNRNLEDLAATIFRAWFVDFEPVRAKAAGQTPAGMDAETAALFPDQLVESALGDIPEGWRVSNIGTEVVVLGGSTPSTREPAYWNGPHPFATPKDLSKLETPVLLSTERSITDSGLARISSGLIPSRSVLMSSRAPIGYLAINEVAASINQGMIAMVCDQYLSPYFVLAWARSSMAQIEARANGTTFLEVSKRNFRLVPVLVPADTIRAQFDQIAQPLYERIVANEEQSGKLVELRDLLLPRLMSGELRIPVSDTA